jgi:hypothetical protein
MHLQRIYQSFHLFVVYQKIISGDLCNLQIPINITSQEKLHNLYYFGWVIMATRKEIIRMKEALSLPKHAQSIEVCAVFYTTSCQIIKKWKNILFYFIFKVRGTRF